MCHLYINYFGRISNGCDKVSWSLLLFFLNIFYLGLMMLKQRIYRLSQFSIWCVRSHMHMPAYVLLVWYVSKIACTTSVFVWEIVTKKIKERTKTSNSIVDLFLVFVNLLLAWMLYFHVWFQNKRKFLVWRESYNQFGIYQPFHVSLIELQQSNWNNPKTYLEPCQTSKMKCFVKMVNG